MSVALFTIVDRTPYKEMSFYEEFDQHLTGWSSDYQSQPSGELHIGMSKVSIVPSDTVPLAGYSGRDPMEYQEIADSVFVRTFILDNGYRRVAIMSLDLLILHPELTAEFYRRALDKGWQAKNLFLGATHSHSSIGGWSPGWAGEWVTGEYDVKYRNMIVDAMLTSLDQAGKGMVPAGVDFNTYDGSSYVKNRLIKDGEEDTQLRQVTFDYDYGSSALSTFSAHATCLNAHTNYLSADYPGEYNRRLTERYDSAGLDMSVFMAGAVASMGPEGDKKGLEKVVELGEGLAQIVQSADQNERGTRQVSLFTDFIKVPLRSPQLKVSRNLKIRPWLFRSLLGEYETRITVLKMNDILLIGTPCDFSGELANPLYEYAASKGLNLIITSFNGGYIGYVTKDEWYDLEKYETRTMNWYGPDSGAYFSEIISRIIDTVAE